MLRVTGLRNERLVREAELRAAARASADSASTRRRRPHRARRRARRRSSRRPRHDRRPLRRRGDVVGGRRRPLRRRAAVEDGARADPAAPGRRRPGRGRRYTNQPARRDAKTLAPELRAHLRSTLPDHMVPTAFVLLDALPRTPNGKIDRNALPAPDRSRVEDAETLVAAEGDLEETIATIWQDILSLDAVGVETNLFDLGANSLMMVRASSRLGEALGRKVSLVEMFGYPTVRSLAAHLGAGDGDERGRAHPEPGPRRGPPRGDAPSPGRPVRPPPMRARPRSGHRRRGRGRAGRRGVRRRRRQRWWRDDRADGERPVGRAVRRAPARQGRHGRTDDDVGRRDDHLRRPATPTAGAPSSGCTSRRPSTTRQ